MEEPPKVQTPPLPLKLKQKHQEEQQASRSAKNDTEIILRQGKMQHYNTTRTPVLSKQMAEVGFAKFWCVFENFILLVVRPLGKLTIGSLHTVHD